MRDEGIAAPDTLIEDAPRRFDDYQPTDFDRIFHGPVTARVALAHSLNVPAVAVLDRLGPAAFEARIEAAGARLARPQARLRDAGLSLALGGAGISLRDLALLYAALGDGGIAKPLAWTQAEEASRKRDPGVRLLRAESAAQVLDILRQAPPPDGRAPLTLTRATAAMAYKTGTSYGFRDAVAVGVVDGYVIAIWTGRPDGAARPGMTGHAAALPLLFDAADLVDPGGGEADPAQPRLAPVALRRLDPDSEGPHLIFPPNGASVLAPGFGPASAGLVLAAEGRSLSWYVDGAPVRGDPVSGQSIWRPASPGFYHVTAVDPAGRRADAKVRITGATP
jgi:penicillin-binding protein 1C